MKFIKVVLSDSVHKAFKTKCAIDDISMKDKLDLLVKEYIEFGKGE